MHRQRAIRVAIVEVTSRMNRATFYQWITSPAPVLSHQSGATAIDWSVSRHAHIALFRKPVSISRHLSAQPQMSDQYTHRSLLKGAFVGGMMHLWNICTCMFSGPAEGIHPRDAEVLNRPGQAWLG